MMEPGIEQRKGRSRSPIAALCGSPEAEKATAHVPDLANSTSLALTSRGPCCVSSGYD